MVFENFSLYIDLVLFVIIGAFLFSALYVILRSFEIRVHPEHYNVISMLIVGGLFGMAIYLFQLTIGSSQDFSVQLGIFGIVVAILAIAFNTMGNLKDISKNEENSNQNQKKPHDVSKKIRLCRNAI